MTDAEARPNSGRFTRKPPGAAALPRCEAWIRPYSGSVRRCANSAPYCRDSRPVCLMHKTVRHVAFDPEAAGRLPPYRHR